jgi:hypothetical protein
MRDVDDLLRDLRPRAPAPMHPPAPGSRRSRGLVVVYAVAALAAIVVIAVPAPPTFRGRSGHATLDLRMTVERGGVAVRASPEVPLAVGERVYFRVASEGPGMAHLWVEGPSGREPIAVVEVDAAPRDVGTEKGLTAYRVDEPGTYVFRASVEGVGVCRGCPTIELVAR